MDELKNVVKRMKEVKKKTAQAIKRYNDILQKQVLSDILFYSINYINDFYEIFNIGKTSRIKSYSKVIKLYIEAFQLISDEVDKAEENGNEIEKVEKIINKIRSLNDELFETLEISKHKEQKRYSLLTRINEWNNQINNSFKILEEKQVLDINDIGFIANIRAEINEFNLINDFIKLWSEKYDATTKDKIHTNNYKKNFVREAYELSIQEFDEEKIKSDIQKCIAKKMQKLQDIINNPNLTQEESSNEAEKVKEKYDKDAEQLALSQNLIIINNNAAKKAYYLCLNILNKKVTDFDDNFKIELVETHLIRNVVIDLIFKKTRAELRNLYPILSKTTDETDGFSSKLNDKQEVAQEQGEELSEFYEEQEKELENQTNFELNHQPFDETDEQIWRL